jgi:hypothetical protein
MAAATYAAPAKLEAQQPISNQKVSPPILVLAC